MVRYNRPPGRDPSVSSIVDAYREWVDVDEFAVIRNIETEQVFAAMSSKLGNRRHAAKTVARYLPLIKSFEETALDRPMPKGREDHRMVNALFITLTYDHKLYSPVEAYARCSADINRFKAHITKLLRSPYVSLSVKEGTRSGYPASHMILIFYRPLPAFRHKGKWRVQSYELYQKIHAAWQSASGSPNCDIRAIVDNSIDDHGRSRSAIGYAMKYMTKCVEELRDPESRRIAETTNAMMKYTGCRNVIGKSFLQLFGLADDTDMPLDLMEMKNELKLLTKRRDELKAMEAEFSASWGWLASPQYAELIKVYRRIAEVKDRIRELIPPSPWIYVGNKQFRPGERAQMQTWLESFDSYNKVIEEGRHQMDLFAQELFIRTMLST